MDIPQKVKVDGRELSLNKRPETPEEMRRLKGEKRENKHKGLKCTCSVKVNVISNYQTRLT